MSNVASPRAPRLQAVLRDGERVTPLELFFDLVFVLALTQCTALTAATPTWEGLAQGMLVLGVLWWSWVGLRELPALAPLALLAAALSLLIAYETRIYGEAGQRARRPEHA